MGVSFDLILSKLMMEVDIYGWLDNDIIILIDFGIFCI